MNIFTYLKNQIEKKLKKFAFSAVIYAENYIGKGKGEAKKALAIKWLMNKLPLWAQPFAPFIEPALNEIADKLIEKAVEEFHKIQGKGTLK